MAAGFLHLPGFVMLAGSPIAQIDETAVEIRQSDAGESRMVCQSPPKSWLCVRWIRQRKEVECQRQPWLDSHVSQVHFVRSVQPVYNAFQIRQVVLSDPRDATRGSAGHPV